MYHRKDAFYRRAKAAGYRSRAAFKLLELADSERLFRRGDRVVELGAWPGGWLQVAAQRVGVEGRVVGVDLQAIAPLPARNVTVVTGNIDDATTREEVVRACGGTVDIILSDLAPKLSGVRSRDDARALALADIALDVAAQILRPGGKLVVKLFMSGDLPEYLARLRRQFESVHTTRPDATRKRSAEIYAIAVGFKSPAPDA